MTSRIRIKTRYWKKASASLWYDQLSELYHEFELNLTHSFHECKVFKIESLEWFGMEMTSRIWIKMKENISQKDMNGYWNGNECFGMETSSRIRIKTRNWKKASASLRYDQLSELYHEFELISPTHYFPWV